MNRFYIRLNANFSFNHVNLQTKSNIYVNDEVIEGTKYKCPIEFTYCECVLGFSREDPPDVDLSSAWVQPEPI